MTPVRFGLIGCSSIAKRRMLPALAASPFARIQHIGSRDPGKAAALAREFKVIKSGSYEEVLADPEVDAVYISTPPALHEHWVRAAAGHGKHVLCEKPAFTDLKTAREMVELCCRHDVALMEGYMFRYHPQHAKVQSLLDAGRIGDLRVVQSEFTFPPPAGGSFRLQPDLGGGVFLDAAGYPVAAAMLLFSAMPVSVYCRLEMDAVSGVDKLVSLMLDFPDGKMAQLLAGYGLHYRSRYVGLGSQGRLEAERAFAVPPDAETRIVLETATGREDIAIPSADQFQLMLADFCNGIISPAGRKTFVKHLLDQHAVMETARLSHVQRRPASISSL